MHGVKLKSMTRQAIVVFGDVVGSRRVPGSSGRLRRLVAELDETYGDEREAPFGFTQGDELQGLLRPGADPFRAVLIAALADDMPPLRWAIVYGLVDDGEGPTTERTGPAFLVARREIGRVRVARTGLVVRTGDPATDQLSDTLTPVLMQLLDRLTARQREVARLMLIDGKRQADVARQLSVSRADISTTAGRAGVTSIAGLLARLREDFAAGVARTTDATAVAAAAPRSTGAPG